MAQKEQLLEPQGFRKKPFGKDIFYHRPEVIYSHYIVHKREAVYPLTQMEFEGHSYSAPHDVDAHLRGTYGDLYMEFPRGKVLNNMVKAKSLPHGHPTADRYDGSAQDVGGSALENSIHK